MTEGKSDLIKEKVIELLKMKEVPKVEIVADNIMSTLKHIPQHEKLTAIVQMVEIARVKRHG